MSDGRNSVVPGLALTFVIAVAAYFVRTLPVPPLTLADGTHPVDALILAILFGLVIRNTLRLPKRLRPGIKYAVGSVLPLAIVFMGAKLDFFDVLRVSGQALVINVLCVLVALAGTIQLCRRTGVGQKLGMLIAIGTAICGGTAIAVTAPIIEADEEDTAFAVGAITLFGLAWIFVFPIVGNAFGMSQTEFGVWAGTGIHATPQVMAAGFAYGETAGDVATIVKLVRVLLLAPLVIGLGAWYAREKRKRDIAHVVERPSWTQFFPPFVFGFIGLAVLNTAHLLPDFTFHLQQSVLWEAGDVPVSMADASTTASGFLITMAMAGVGLGVDVKGLMKVGLKAFYVGLFAAVVLAALSLLLIHVMM